MLGADVSAASSSSDSETESLISTESIEVRVLFPVDLVVVMVMMVWELEKEMLEETIQDVVLFQKEMMVVHLLLIVVEQVVEVLHKQDKEMEMILAPVEQELQFHLI